jgi:hypothetical protein
VSPFFLATLVDLFNRVQQLLRRQQIFFRVTWTNVQITDHPLFIDDYVRALGESSRLVIDAICLHHLAISVAQQRVIDLREIGKSFLRERRVGADAYDLGVFGLKLRIIVRTGRLQIFDSSRAEVEHVEVDQNVLPLETAEL